MSTPTMHENEPKKMSKKMKTIDIKNDDRSKDGLIKVIFDYQGKNVNKLSNLYTAWVTPKIAELYKKKLQSKSLTVRKPIEVK